MKRPNSLDSLCHWGRSHRWADLRHFERDETAGAFAGLTIRHRNHIVALHNWSQGGACVTLPGAARIGERVQLIAGKIRRRGRVVWVARGRAGIEFER